jgi:hypothetical protein
VAAQLAASQEGLSSVSKSVSEKWLYKKSKYMIVAYISGCYSSTYRIFYTDTNKVKWDIIGQGGENSSTK